MDGQINEINLKYTLESGQVFLWYSRKGSYYIVCANSVLKIRESHGQIAYESRPEYVDIRRMFRLDDDINTIIHSIQGKDALIGEAVRRFRGLRIMRQDPFQCLISFMCATNTSIVRVRQMLENICRRFGDMVEFDGNMFYTFPTPERLNDASINDLVGCGLGYRARFIRHAASSYHEIDVEELLDLCYDDARDILLSIKGIGSKVADCVMLFSLEKLEAFPIDVWISRVVARYYRTVVGMDMADIERLRLSPSMYRRVSDMMRGYFGRYAGYAQQYLYCYARAYMNMHNTNKNNNFNK